MTLGTPADRDQPDEWPGSGIIGNPGEFPPARRCTLAPGNGDAADAP